MRTFAHFLLAALIVASCSSVARSFQAGKDPGQRTPQADKAASKCTNVSSQEIEANDAKLNSFSVALNAFTVELVNKVESAANPSDGIDDAQRFIDTHKGNIIALFKGVAGISECQVSQKARTRLTDNFYSQGVKLGLLKVNYGKDAILQAKLQKLMQDYLDMLKEKGTAKPSADDVPARVSVSQCAGTDVPKSELEKNDAAVNSFVDAINVFTGELIERVASAPSPAAGVDDAQHYLDTEKARLRPQFVSVKDIGECRVSAETRKRVIDNFYQDGVKIRQLQPKYGSSPAVKDKIQKLTQDFLDLFKD
jgi:hypothetical protein